MGLFLFIDLTLQLSVYPTLTAFALVLDPVLDDPGQMLQQPQAARTADQFRLLWTLWRSWAA